MGSFSLKEVLRSIGTPASLPNTTVKTTIVRSRRTIAQAHADDRLLVAHGHVAPGQNGKQLAVVPQVAPIKPLRPAGLDNEHELDAAGAEPGTRLADKAADGQVSGGRFGE
jgi:hypothetical protein